MNDRLLYFVAIGVCCALMLAFVLFMKFMVFGIDRNFGIGFGLGVGLGVFIGLIGAKLTVESGGRL